MLRMIFLKCLTGFHKPIPLPDGVAVVIGRSPMVGITDSRLSRKQGKCTAVQFTF